jgi:two-component system, response regulator
LDGLEILRRIRADRRTRRLPVVILTSSNDDTDLGNGDDPGANSYVCRPMRFDASAAAVAQLGAHWLILNEHARPTDDYASTDL